MRIGFEKHPFVTMRSRVDGETPISHSTSLVRSIVSVGWQSWLGQREACQARAFLLRAPFLTSRPVSPAHMLGALTARVVGLERWLSG